MNRISAGMVATVLIAGLLLSGCTKERPDARGGQPTLATGAVSETTPVSVPTSEVGGDVLPTLTPAPTKVKGTTIATNPTSTAVSEPVDVSEAQMTPELQPQESPAAPEGQATPTPIPTMPLPTPVPVLSPDAQPAPDASPTPIPAPQPTESVGYAPSGPTYVVRWGDTLTSIAMQFGVTVQEIMQANGMVNDIIVVGQELVIPGAGPGPSPGGGEIIHIVQPGETLFRIAQNYNTTFQAIAQANQIANPWFIYVGQQLVIPGGSSGSSTTSTSYVVQPGDTLYLIALRHNTTVETLMVANNLANPNFIYPGQVLVIR